MAEVKEGLVSCEEHYRVEIANRFATLKSLCADVDNGDWITVKENTKFKPSRVLVNMN
jgi:hypothetical protein